MVVSFIPCTPDEIRKYFPSFYHKDDCYFEVLKGNEAIGVISIRPLFENACNFGVFMINKYRLTKRIVLEAFNIPSKLGYEKLIISTNNLIVVNFLNYMKKHGIYYVCTMFGKKYYVKCLKD
jgi:hypothetical protein